MQLRDAERKTHRPLTGTDEDRWVRVDEDVYKMRAYLQSDRERRIGIRQRNSEKRLRHQIEDDYCVVCGSVDMCKETQYNLRERILYVEWELRGYVNDLEIANHVARLYERMVRAPCRAARAPVPLRWTAHDVRRHFGMDDYEGCVKIDSRIKGKLLAEMQDELKQLKQRGYRYVNLTQGASGEVHVDTARQKMIQDCRKQVQDLSTAYEAALRKERDLFKKHNIESLWSGDNDNDSYTTPSCSGSRLLRNNKDAFQ